MGPSADRPRVNGGNFPLGQFKNGLETLVRMCEVPCSYTFGVLTNYSPEILYIGACVAKFAW